MSSSVSLYDVLGIPISASNHEIKAAYRKLARVSHPDVVSMRQDQFSSGYDFIKIHKAYSTLSDPEKRADYDKDLMVYSRRRSSVLTAATMAAAASSMANYSTSRFTSRTWETDQCW